MSSSSPIILILGAGHNIGQSNTAEQIYIPSDFTAPNSITNAFAKVKAPFGIPSVVVYNVGAATANPPNDPLSLSIGFAELPSSASKTFIYTGNILNTTITPAYGSGFYYADERKKDGAPAYGDIDGDAHAKLYVGLAEGKTQGPWQQTFVKGVGYKAFPVA
ncbi:hypothetical protein B0O99DRAFT_657369 [Bisporella sp. PMI_857]|nr:hypothetical protein B0O99DRAFT_657369 [Bisporella sp. PMI_857]